MCHLNICEASQIFPTVNHYLLLTSPSQTKYLRNKITKFKHNQLKLNSRYYQQTIQHFHSQTTQLNSIHYLEWRIVRSKCLRNKLWSKCRTSNPNRKYLSKPSLRGRRRLNLPNQNHNHINKSTTPT